MNRGRFVILLHESPRGDHWDFMFEQGMLERGRALTTWAVPPQPFGASFTCLAEPLPDHRSAYLEYEGPISGDRGTVRRVDEGVFETLTTNRYRLTGRLLIGTLTIEPVDDSGIDSGKVIFRFVSDVSTPSQKDTNTFRKSSRDF